MTHLPRKIRNMQRHSGRELQCEVAQGELGRLGQIQIQLELLGELKRGLRSTVKGWLGHGLRHRLGLGDLPAGRVGGGGMGVQEVA